MDRRDIEQLQSAHGYPAVSILLPVYRRSPEDQQQTPVRVKNLIRQAEDRLLQGFSKRDVEPLIRRLEGLAQEIDYAHPQDGLALFVNKDVARFFWLPFLVEERVVMDEHFATRDLVLALIRTTRYRVLVLSERLTRLYWASRDHLTEITEGGFPLPLEMPGVEVEQATSFGVENSALRNKTDRDHFIRIDKTFDEVANKENLPLVVVGIERDLATFKEVSKHKEQIIATLPGRHLETNPHELAQLVWPLVEQALKEKQKEVFQRLDSAISAKRFAYGVDEAWKLAQEGRVNTLVVEQDFRYPAKLNGNGRLVPVDNPTAPNVMDDA
ncbi:MAG: hypothetical protein M3347_04660, partial [Armatimonadota bacterium]|nr:hypothetical protein [Armatimonadota bacterium]